MTVSLPEDFAPDDDDVVIGKGKKFYMHAGNQKLRTIITERMEGYSQAATKTDKSNIIRGVVDTIHSTGGRFVKIDPTDKNRWIIADEGLAREKCSALFRDNIMGSLKRTGGSSNNLRGVSVMGSSSDLINAFRATKISSSNSRNNLRMAISTGNILKQSRSGQFSAAKKASFSRLGAAGAGIGGGKNMGNATWSTARSPRVKKGASSRLQDLLANVKMQELQNRQVQAAQLGQVQPPPQQMTGVASAGDNTMDSATMLQKLQLQQKNQQLAQQIQENQMKLQQLQQHNSGSNRQNSQRAQTALQQVKELEPTPMQEDMLLQQQLQTLTAPPGQPQSATGLLGTLGQAPQQQEGVPSSLDPLPVGAIPSLEPTPIREQQQQPASVSGTADLDKMLEADIADINVINDNNNNTLQDATLGDAVDDFDPLLQMPMFELNNASDSGHFGL